MTLLARINRLFKADVHAVLDSIEEPNLLLQQSIREMESALDQTMCMLVNQQNTAKRLDELLAQSLDSQLQSQQEIELCLEHQNDDLARELLRKKITQSRCIDSLKSELAETNQLIAELQLKNSEQENALAKLKEQADSYNSRSGQYKWAAKTDSTITEAELEIALLKEKQRFAKPRKSASRGGQ